MKGCGGEKWGAEGITARGGVDGIETEGGKDVPRRHLPAVLIAAKAVGAVKVETAANAVHKHLRSFGATDIVVKVCHVVARFVAVGILPHHTRRENRQGGGVGALVREHAVEQRGKTLAAAMLHQSLDVVLHRPEILSRIAFANIRRVVVGTERADKCAIAAARLHIAGGGIVDVAPITCTPGKLTRLLHRARPFGQPGDAGIVERIFEGARERPIVVVVRVFHVTRHIAQRALIADAAILILASRGYTEAQGAANVVGRRHDVFEKGIGNDRRSVVANHHVGLAAPQRPDGQPPVLFGKVEQRAHHFCGAFRAEESIERVRGAVGVPKREGGIIARRGAICLAVGTGIRTVGVAIKRWREQSVIKRGVKRDALVRRAAFYLDFSQSLVPACLRGLAVNIEIIVRRFCREVLLCTFRAGRREGGDDGQQRLIV